MRYLDAKCNYYLQVLFNNKFLPKLIEIFGIRKIFTELKFTFR